MTNNSLITTPPILSPPFVASCKSDATASVGKEWGQWHGLLSPPPSVIWGCCGWTRGPARSSTPRTTTPWPRAASGRCPGPSAPSVPSSLPPSTKQKKGYEAPNTATLHTGDGSTNLTCAAVARCRELCLCDRTHGRCLPPCLPPRVGRWALMPPEGSGSDRQNVALSGPSADR